MQRNEKYKNNKNNWNIVYGMIIQLKENCWERNGKGNKGNAKMKQAWCQRIDKINTFKVLEEQKIPGTDEITNLMLKCKKKIQNWILNVLKNIIEELKYRKKRRIVTFFKK